MKSKIIKTDRLILRPWQDSDLQAFALINQDPKVLEFLPNILTIEETVRWIATIKQHFIEHGFGLWAATIKDTGELIGYVGLSVPTFSAHFTPRVEIGWRLSPIIGEKDTQLKQLKQS